MRLLCMLHLRMLLLIPLYDGNLRHQLGGADHQVIQSPLFGYHYNRHHDINCVMEATANDDNEARGCEKTKQAREKG